MARAESAPLVKSNAANARHWHLAVDWIDYNPLETVKAACGSEFTLDKCRERDGFTDEVTCPKCLTRMSEQP